MNRRIPTGKCNRCRTPVCCWANYSILKYIQNIMLKTSLLKWVKVIYSICRYCCMANTHNGLLKCGTRKSSHVRLESSPSFCVELLNNRLEGNIASTINRRTVNVFDGFKTIHCNRWHLDFVMIFDISSTHPDKYCIPIYASSNNLWEYFYHEQDIILTEYHQ